MCCQMLTVVCVDSGQTLQFTGPSTSLNTSNLSAETINQLRLVSAAAAGGATIQQQQQHPVTTTTTTSTAASMENEVIQLRHALSERTLEAERLTQELERANRVAEELREMCREQAQAAVTAIVDPDDAADNVFA